MSVARRTIGPARNPALDAWIADDGSFTRPAPCDELDLTGYPMLPAVSDLECNPMMRSAPDGVFTRVAVHAHDARTRIEIAILLLLATAFAAIVGRCVYAMLQGWRP